MSLSKKRSSQQTQVDLTDLWTDPDCLLLIFAASSAEFAVNPSAEWLFYTGKLPADPVGRFISTIHYMRELMRAPSEEAYVAACRRIRGLHTKIEDKRGQLIPDEAYRDVLLMGMQNSVRALEVSQGRQITAAEAEAFVDNYSSMARHMGVPDYPQDYAEFLALRARRLASYETTKWTAKLYDSYRRALGPVGYWMLRKLTPALVEPQVATLAGLKPGLLSAGFARMFSRLRVFQVHRYLLPAPARRMWTAANRAAA